MKTPNSTYKETFTDPTRKGEDIEVEIEKNRQLLEAIDAMSDEDENDESDPQLVTLDKPDEENPLN